MDAGPIYLKKPLWLHGSAEEIFLRAADVIADMIVELLAKDPEPQSQQGEPTIFKRRTPEDGDLAAALSLNEAFDLMRMLDAQGYPNAFLNIGPFRIEFFRASRKANLVEADVRIRLADSAGDGKEER